jgi:hypothetical protein
MCTKKYGDSFLELMYIRRQRNVTIWRARHQTFVIGKSDGSLSPNINDIVPNVGHIRSISNPLALSAIPLLLELPPPVLRKMHASSTIAAQNSAQRASAPYQSEALHLHLLLFAALHHTQLIFLQDQKLYLYPAKSNSSHKISDNCHALYSVPPSSQFFPGVGVFTFLLHRSLIQRHDKLSLESFHPTQNDPVLKYV